MDKNNLLIFAYIFLFAFTSCSNEVRLDINEERVSGLSDIGIEDISYSLQNNDVTAADSLNKSGLYQLVISDYSILEPTYVSADTFIDMEYLLLVKEGKGFYTNSGDMWYEYALLGGEYDSYEKGRDFYEEINGPYVVEIQADLADARFQSDEGGFHNQFFKRHVAAVSVDGKRVLLKTYHDPFQSAEVFYEIYEGDELIGSYNYYEVIDRSQTNYTANLEYITLEEDRKEFYKVTDLNNHLERKVYPISTITDMSDTLCVKNIEDAEGNKRVVVYKILDDDVFYESDLVDTFPSIAGISGSKLIVGYANKKGENYYNYFEIDMVTGESTYLFTNREGVLSPDGKYLAYSTGYTPDDGPGLVEKGYFIYCLETGETAFILSQIRDKENDYYVMPDRTSNFIGWISKSGLALGNQLKKQVSALYIHREITNLINNQHFILSKGTELNRQTVFKVGFV